MDKEIRAVIFDLGGTLIEYAGAYQTWPELETPGFAAAYAALEEGGTAVPSFAQFRDAGFAILPARWQRATEGAANLRLVDLLAEITAELAITAPEALIEAAADRYQTAVCGQALPLEAAQETLTAVQAQGYRLGLLSNTMFTGAAHEADLQRFGLDGYFEATLFSADAAKWKPAAAPFEQLLHELQVAPQQAVFVGDSPVHDVAGGKAAGMWTIYLRASDRFGEPGAVQPDATIHHLRELPGVLARWRGENGRG